MKRPSHPPDGCSEAARRALLLRHNQARSAISIHVAASAYEVREVTSHNRDSQIRR